MFEILVYILNEKYFNPVYVKDSRFSRNLSVMSDNVFFFLINKKSYFYDIFYFNVDDDDDVVYMMILH